jgi:hypothetical protein
MNSEEKEEEKKTNEEKYIEQMNSLQLKAYMIASDHLKSSFSISRSNGFKEFMKKNLDKNVDAAAVLNK